MKYLFLIIIICVGHLTANVYSGTQHYYDAVAVDNIISESRSANTYMVRIAYVDGMGMCYGVTYLDDRWEGANDNDFGIAVLAVAFISSSTNWSSDYLIVMFGDYDILKVRTSACRWLWNNLDNMDQGDYDNWFAENVIVY